MSGGTGSGAIHPAGNLPPLNAVVLDASVWISRLLPQEAEHAASTAWVNQHMIGGGILVIPALFAIEIAAAISRRTKNPSTARRVIAQIGSLSMMRITSLDAQLIQQATDLAADHGLRAGDAIYVALAKQLAIPVVSNDEELRRLATVAGVTAIKP